jgi:DNA gyrase subunit B
MPELIRRGHLYIAQPPLYKVTRGKSQQYLLDERALEDYLYTEGVSGADLTLASGETLAGADLADLVARARKAEDALSEFPARFPRDIIVQTALARALHDAPAEGAQAIADQVSTRLDAISEDYERGWRGAPDGEGGYKFVRDLRGVVERHHFTRDLLVSADARKLQAAAEPLIEAFAKPPTLKRKDQFEVLTGPPDLLRAVRKAGEHGVQIQRYKGLGEMNPDQLWETTLDDNARTLLQVKVKEADAADDIFSRLMGDVVEPRRNFIQENALAAALDV